MEQALTSALTLVGAIMLGAMVASGLEFWLSLASQLSLLSAWKVLLILGAAGGIGVWFYLVVDIGETAVR